MTPCDLLRYASDGPEILHRSRKQQIFSISVISLPLRVLKSDDISIFRKIMIIFRNFQICSKTNFFMGIDKNT